MANIKQVASLAELSVSCVSKYLKNPNSVLESSRQKIEFAIRELNYVPSAVARNLRSKRTGIIRIISHSITNPFFAELFETLRYELEKNGYLATLQSIQYMEYRSFSSRDFEQIDGAIICFIENESTLKSFIENAPKDFPIVNIHGCRPEADIPTILTDVKRGTFDAVNCLISSGCRHLAYIGANENSTVSRLKFKGFQEAFGDENGSADYSMARNYNFSMKSGYKAASELFTENPHLDGVFCENDLLAAGAVHFFIDQKKSIPDDIRIIGYDDVPLASMFIPSISSISIPLSEICHSGCTELISLINGKPAEEQYYHPTLVQRQTTRCTR